MARCTKEESLETRSRILDAAEDAFHAKGVARTSLADVAEAAGVTRGAIYWHFRNKADLFEAMCDRVRLPMEAMIEAGADDREPDPLGRLREVCVFILREAVANPHSRKVFDVVFHRCEWIDGEHAMSARHRAAFEQGTVNIERILRNAMARGQLPADLDPRLAAVMLHAMISGLLNNWLFAPEGFALDAVAGRMIDACVLSLRDAPSLRVGA